MFRVDLDENRLVPLEEKRFSDFEIREREHLQERLIQSPNALGEELLILQKEFDGFKDTRERLDVLALDKERRLVIIENKTDDSGRDVVWQALKYVAFCSTLTKSELIDIYQQYLNLWNEGEDAKSNLCEFLDVEDLDDTILNGGSDQRLVLVAANFRKEVTSTVLWLIDHGIQAQCFRVIPYKYENELFIDFQQVIPTPEAADYMIRTVTKEVEEKSAHKVRRELEALRREFWSLTLERLRARGISRFEKLSPSKENWLSSATGISGCGINIIFAKKFARVELYLSKSQKEENKRIFDQLALQKLKVESLFGAELQWQRLDDKKASRICFSRPFDGFDRENWPEIVEWLCDHTNKLETAFSESLRELQKEISFRNDESLVEHEGSRV